MLWGVQGRVDGTVARVVMVSHNRKVVVETRKKKEKGVEEGEKKERKTEGRSG